MAKSKSRKKANPNRPNYHPYYWPIWLLFGIGWCVAHLPFRWQLTLGRGFGRLLYHVGKERAYVTHRNIEVCMPQLSKAEHDALVKKNFESVGMGFVELAMAYWGEKNTLHHRFTFKGLEHLEAAKAEGKGVLVVACHMTSLELMLRLFSETWPCAALYKPNNNPFFEAYSTAKRARYTLPIPAKKLRGFLDHLKAGGSAIYLADQDYGAKHSVFAPFFGVQCATIKRPPDYLEYSGAVLMPVLFGRNDDDSGYYAEVFPPLDYPTGDEIQDATTLNQWVEKNVLRHPDQYLWQHRRFKRRPPGEPWIYER